MVSGTDGFLSRRFRDPAFAGYEEDTPQLHEVLQGRAEVRRAMRNLKSDFFGNDLVMTVRAIKTALKKLPMSKRREMARWPTQSTV